ncbi:DUF4282 domain-containing protein [Alteribacter natronophilus]|uniref:DUF4282 domain-containing protein n=1 Tax=Alteribacter natronophilus TaxID=2583810 RepID=UPI00110F0B9D|nr:DUF4282 domain-containing protein [Alteribacter natronophilus]TMW70624.1 DUF4282 domain-containing protein [Alteribacter natronophilus]
MQDFLNFNRMITPMIIKIIFWIGAGFSVLLGFITMFDGGVSVLIGLFVIVVGPLLVRIYCELLIIFFKVQESLHSINTKVDRLAEHRNTPTE